MWNYSCGWQFCILRQQQLLISLRKLDSESKKVNSEQNKLKKLFFICSQNQQNKTKFVSLVLSMQNRTKQSWIENFEAILDAQTVYRSSRTHHHWISLRNLDSKLKKNFIEPNWLKFRIYIAEINKRVDLYFS